MKLNKPICASDYGNTGFGDCFLDLKKFSGAIKVPGPFVITKEDLADLREFLLAKIHASPALRIFPYHNFKDLTSDNTEEPQIETTGYGAKYKTRDGDYDVTFRYFDGGVQLHQEIQKNEGLGYYLFYDDNGVIVGYRTSEGLKGIPAQFFPLPWRFATGSASTQLLLRFIFDSKYINKGNLGFIKVTDFNLFDLKGLQDVEIDLVELAANVATVQLITKISDENLYEAYHSNLAATDAFAAYDEDGNTVDITTVTANAAKEGFDITFDNTDFSAAEKVFLKGSAAATWRAAPIDVEGFEARIPLTIEVPAS